MSLYTVATYSQHSVASNIFASRAVFAVLRPISIALSRHQFWAVCDPIIGPVAGALQSQRDALSHRAWLTREQSSIENDVGIQVTHLLVLCHLTNEKLNKTTVNSGNLTQNLHYFNVSIYSLKIQTNFLQIVLFSGHKHGEKLSFWKLTPLDCSL